LTRLPADNMFSGPAEWLIRRPEHPRV